MRLLVFVFAALILSFGSVSTHAELTISPNGYMIIGMNQEIQPIIDMLNTGGYTDSGDKIIVAVENALKNEVSIKELETLVKSLSAKEIPYDDLVTIIYFLTDTVKSGVSSKEARTTAASKALECLGKGIGGSILVEIVGYELIEMATLSGEVGDITGARDKFDELQAKLKGLIK